jgi:hypothetical protein
MNVQKFSLQYESRTLKKIKKKIHDHLIVDYSLFHDHVQTQSFCVLYAFRTNAQNSLFLILYLMMTFRRRISVFCMSFVRMLKILYFWFFISWWRLDAAFLCFVCVSYECSKFFIFDSLFHDDVQTQHFYVLYASRTNAQDSLFLILYLMMMFRRRIFVFDMRFVRMLRFLYLWFFISWSRSVCRIAHMRQRQLETHDFITCLV